jgi:phosphatidylglycerol---prolipoprotein diacylglyceryl transferase
VHPQIFGLIKSYGLLLSISFMVGIWLCIIRGRTRGFAAETIIDFSFTVFVSALVGVRLFFVLTHWSTFDPWYEIFFIWQGGLTLYGGIIMATLTVWYFCRRRGIAFLSMADIMAPSVILGIGITRLGCFLNGCCFGRPTDLPFGIAFPLTCSAGRMTGGAHLHPTQLYSSFLGFFIFALLLFWERFDKRRGGTFARFLMFYGLARFTVDVFRWYETGTVSMAGLTISQMISIALILTGGALMMSIRRGNAD